MLNKKIISVGSGGVALAALLMVFAIGDMPTETYVDELPTKLGGGFPPAKKLTDSDVGKEVNEFKQTKIEGNAQSDKVPNTEYTKYKELLVLDDYKKLHVFVDDRDHKDVILGKKPVTPNLTDKDILYSQDYIWITINPHRDGVKVTQDYYLDLPLNEDYNLIEINDEVINAPYMQRYQLIDPVGDPSVVTPSDLWFVTENLSYTIRGHITQDESVKLVNIILSIEE